MDEGIVRKRIMLVMGSHITTYWFESISFLNITDFHPTEYNTNTTLCSRYINIKTDSFDISFASTSVHTMDRLYNDIVLFFDDQTKNKIKIDMSGPISISGYGISLYRELEYSIE